MKKEGSVVFSIGSLGVGRRVFLRAHEINVGGPRAHVCGDCRTRVRGIGGVMGEVQTTVS